MTLETFFAVLTRFERLRLTSPPQLILCSEELPSTSLSAGCRPVLPRSSAGSSASSNAARRLDTYHPGQKATVLTPALRPGFCRPRARNPATGPPIGVAANWRPRWRQQDAVHRVWKEAGLKPHRLERYLASDDPEFENKAADIIGLYLRPPQHAAVFCVVRKPPSKPWIARPVLLSDLRCRPLCHLFVLLSLRRHRHLAACCRESIARISGQHDLAIFKLWQSHCNNSFA